MDDFLTALAYGIIATFLVVIIVVATAATYMSKGLFLIPFVLLGGLMWALHYLGDRR